MTILLGMVVVVVVVPAGDVSDCLSVLYLMMFIYLCTLYSVFFLLDSRL